MDIFVRFPMKEFDELDLELIEKVLDSSITSGAGTDIASPMREVSSDIDAVRVDEEVENGADTGKSSDLPPADMPDAAWQTAPASDEGKKRSSAMSLYDWVQCVVSALVAGVLIFIFVGRAINIEGSSMYPTLHNGDEVIVSNLFYSPKAGDVVVLRTTSYSSSPLVKRIIATEGQTVDIDFDAGVVYVDGAALDESYVNAAIHFRDSFEGPVTVPEGCIFVLGDNRNESSDSRNERIGMVDERCIIGKVICILLPAYDRDGERDWTRFGKVA